MGKLDGEVLDERIVTKSVTFWKMTRSRLTDEHVSACKGWSRKFAVSVYPYAKQARFSVHNNMMTVSLDETKREYEVMKLFKMEIRYEENSFSTTYYNKISISMCRKTFIIFSI